MRQPLVLVPGIQGRCEYFQPAIEALSADFDVIATPLCGERGCRIRDASVSIEEYAGLVLDELDRRHLQRAVVCGLSFGGLVALRFAARHPVRTSALVLASTPGPGWHLRPRHEFYARLPWIFGPLFLAESPFRLRAEIAAALPARRDHARYTIWQLKTLVAAPLSLKRMAERARLITSLDVARDSAEVVAPTLVVTGEPQLDRVVSAEATREYLRLIRQSEGAVLERTGHLGSITRPDAFARLVRDFVDAHVSHSDVRASA